MHDATLLPVHHRKRVAARVFALLGQLHQFGELLVDHLDQSGILLGEGFEEVRIVGLQLGRQVRIADLEPDGEPTVALQQTALVAALQGSVALGLAGPEDVAQLDRTATLHLLHRRGQLRRGEPPVVSVKIVTRPHLLPVATLAGNFDHFPAGQVRWAVPVVTGSLALVGAVCPGGGAVLFADFPFDGDTFVFVAWSDALVAATGQWLGACKATAERALEARDCFSLFVFAVAVLGGEDDAGRTIGIRMAVVQDRVGTRVLTRAGFIAMRFFRSTRHWWIDNARSTLAGQFIKRDTMANWTGTFVTGFITTMSTAG